MNNIFMAVLIKHLPPCKIGTLHVKITGRFFIHEKRKLIFCLEGHNLAEDYISGFHYPDQHVID